MEVDVGFKSKISPWPSDSDGISSGEEGSVSKLDSLGVVDVDGTQGAQGGEGIRVGGGGDGDGE